MAGNNRKFSEITAAWVGSDRKKFASLIDFMIMADSQMAARAAWVASIVVDSHPRLLAPHLASLLRHFDSRQAHPPVLRNFFRMLQTAPIPGESEGLVLAAAMAALGGPGPVAVKVNAMSVLKRLTAGMPELLREIHLLIDEQMHDASPGFRARARREFGRSASL